MVPEYTKGGKCEANNYHFVFLLSVLSKLLETVVASRVTGHLERPHLLCTRKFAPHKTQLLIVSRSSASLHLNFSGDKLVPRDEM